MGASSRIGSVCFGHCGGGEDPAATFPIVGKFAAFAVANFATDQKAKEKGRKMSFADNLTFKSVVVLV